MKNHRLYPVLGAITLILIATLACNAANPTPGASDFYMAKDAEGTNRTEVFAPEDDFFVHFNVSGVEPGANFQSRWYVLDLEGQDPNVPIQTIDYAYEEGIGKIYFQLTGQEPWPPATYQVEVYMNDAKIGEQQFTVQ
jgi:hypothetical protein